MLYSIYHESKITLKSCFFCVKMQKFCHTCATLLLTSLYNVTNYVNH